jgi:hypothetical protein
MNRRSFFGSLTALLAFKQIKCLVYSLHPPDPDTFKPITFKPITFTPYRLKSKNIVLTGTFVMEGKDLYLYKP